MKSIKEMFKSKWILAFYIFTLSIVFIDCGIEKNAIERTNDIEVNYSQK